MKSLDSKKEKKHRHSFDEYMGYPYGSPDKKLYKCKCGEEKFEEESTTPPPNQDKLRKKNPNLLGESK